MLLAYIPHVFCTHAGVNGSLKDYIHEKSVYCRESFHKAAKPGLENKIIQEILHVFRFILESMNLKLFLLDNANLQNKIQQHHSGMQDFRPKKTWGSDYKDSQCSESVPTLSLQCLL